MQNVQNSLNPVSSSKVSKSLINFRQKTSLLTLSVALVVGGFLGTETSFAQALARQSFIIDFEDRDRMLLQGEGFPADGPTKAQLKWLVSYQPKVKAQVAAARDAYDQFFRSIFPGANPSGPLPGRAEEIDLSQLGALDHEKTVLIAREQAVSLLLAELDPSRVKPDSTLQKANYCPDCARKQQQNYVPNDTTGLESLLRKL